MQERQERVSPGEAGKKPIKDSSIFIELTSSNYKKAAEAKDKTGCRTLSDGKHFVSASKVALSDSSEDVLITKERNREIGFEISGYIPVPDALSALRRILRRER